MGELVDTNKGIEDFDSNSFDVVTSFDALEHVREDWPHVANLLRVARFSVIIATPNWFVSQAQNPHHVREYTPRQLFWMCSCLGHGILRMWTGDGFGNTIIQHEEASSFWDSMDDHLMIEVVP